MFVKVLIANRGEIAVRIARTLRRMGIATVAVYSDADRDAPHMRACDEAVGIGPAAATDSYLKVENLLNAIRKTGAEAVHPGYGFLAENADFAEALEQEGVTFIGPRPETIRAMGSKSAAKNLLEEAGVPTTPGYQGDDQTVESFLNEAKRIGYPVLLKAVAGGGGKGMRLVEREADLEEALKSGQREAKAAFGDDRFLIEKYISHARHVEVQIFGDGRGNVVHMFERDCSLQRRHQKVIEEAPAPDMPAPVRERLLQAGVDAGKAVSYRSAGTVEFLYDGAEGIYFMEMNTRLQVEHPVSEAITGLDFVEWQLRIAAGEGLPLTQQEIHEFGHAVEARLYAENPSQNFAPSIGAITTLRLPEDMARIDSGIEEGQAITPYYDPMIAKIITHGATRNEALGAMRGALEHTRVAGLETNTSFLHALVSAPAFVEGDVSTRFIDEHGDALLMTEEVGPKVWAATALWKCAPRRGRIDDPWAALAGFRLNRPRNEVMWISHDGRPAVLKLSRTGEIFEAVLQPDASAAARREGREPEPSIYFSFSGVATDSGSIRLCFDDVFFTAFAAPQGAGVRIWIGADHWDVAFPDPRAGISSHHSSEGSLVAPFPGVVTMLMAQPGDAIAAGAPLLVMEAMKMEHPIKAPFDGTVRAYRFKPGEPVNGGDLLVEFEEIA